MKTVLNHFFEATGYVRRTNCLLDGCLTDWLSRNHQTAGKSAYRPIASFFVILLFASAAFGQVKSPIVGVSEKELPAGRLSYFGIPFERDAVFSGKVNSFASNSESGEILIVVEGSPGWDSNEFALNSYVRMTSGRSAGRMGRVTGNSDHDLVVEGGFAVRNGDSFEVIPSWTLDLLFPPETQTAFHVSTGNILGERSSELYLYPMSGEGIDTSPKALAFITEEGWRLYSEGFPEAGDVVIPSGSLFAVLHHFGGGSSFKIVGNVENVPRLVPIKSLKGRGNENFVSTNRPTETTLRRLGLRIGGGDRLQFFSNTDPDQSWAPDYEFRFDGKHWRTVFGSMGVNQVANDFVIPPGAALVVKKAAGKSDKLSFWKQLP